MKKTKLLLAVAMVFAALSFGFKAKAQTMVQVSFIPYSNSYPYSFATTATWIITMHNNSTNADYF